MGARRVRSDVRAAVRPPERGAGSARRWAIRRGSANWPRARHTQRSARRGRQPRPAAMSSPNIDPEQAMTMAKEEVLYRVDLFNAMVRAPPPRAAPRTRPLAWPAVRDRRMRATERLTDASARHRRARATRLAEQCVLRQVHDQATQGERPQRGREQLRGPLRRQVLAGAAVAALARRPLPHATRSPPAPKLPSSPHQPHTPSPRPLPTHTRQVVSTVGALLGNNSQPPPGGAP